MESFTLRAPALTPEWTFSPTAVPFTFTWASNFGFQGRARLDPMKFLVEMQSPCCRASLTPFKGSGIYAATAKDQWLCFSCERQWAGLDYKEERLELSSYLRLENGTLGEGLKGGFLLSWTTDWLSHIMEEPLIAQLTAHGWAEALAALAKRVDEWYPTFEEQGEALAARMEAPSYADLDKIDELVWKHTLAQAWTWARNAGTPCQ